MTLASALARNVRPQVPENILSQCEQDDKVVVENILLVVTETIPYANLASTTLTKIQNKYRLSLPLASSYLVTLSQLRAIQTYNPARISEIILKKSTSDESSSANNTVLLVDVVNESTPISVSEIEVLRVCKRRRWGLG